MFGFIKKLFGGLFGFLGSLFGGKKSGKKSKDSGYFLEFEEAQGTGSPTGQPEVAPKAAAAPAPEGESPAPTAAVAATGTPEAPAAPPAPAAKPTVAAAPVAPSKPLVTAKPAVPAGPATFAPQYLVPKATNSRRRPGPSLSPYLTMAKQMR